MENFLYLLPEVFLFVVATILLILGLFIKNIRLINNLAIISLLIGLILIINQPYQSIFDNSYVIDEFSTVFKSMILIGSIASLMMFLSLIHI